MEQLPLATGSRCVNHCRAQSCEPQSKLLQLSILLYADCQSSWRRLSQLQDRASPPKTGPQQHSTPCGTLWQSECRLSLAWH